MRRSTLLILGLGLGILAPLGCGGDSTPPTPEAAKIDVPDKKDSEGKFILQNPYNETEKKK